MEKEMATRSSIIAWRIPWTEKPGRLQSTGSHSQTRLEQLSMPRESFGLLPRGSGVKNPPTVQEMQETWVQSLGREDPLEKGTVFHSSILAWRIPMDRGAWQATIHRVTKSWTQLKQLISINLISLYKICKLAQVFDIANIRYNSSGNPK